MLHLEVTLQLSPHGRNVSADGRSGFSFFLIALFSLKNEI